MKWILLEALAIFLAGGILVGAAVTNADRLIPPAYSGPAYNHDVPEFGPARGNSGGVITWDDRKEIGV